MKNLFVAASKVIRIYKILTVIRRYISGSQRQRQTSLSH